MRSVLCSALLVLLVTNLYAQEVNPHRTQFYAGFSTGSLGSGKQYDLLHDGLSPQPYQYSYVAPTFGMRHYFFSNVGFEANGDVSGNVTVSAKSASPLECYLLSSAQTGILFRYIWNSESENSLEGYFGGGGNHTWFQYSSKYKAVFPSGFVFYDVSPAWGYYGKVGACYYFVGSLFLDAQVEYAAVRNLINMTNTAFDGAYLKTNIHVGFAF